MYGYYYHANWYMFLQIICNLDNGIEKCEDGRFVGKFNQKKSIPMVELRL